MPPAKKTPPFFNTIFLYFFLFFPPRRECERRRWDWVDDKGLFFCYSDGVFFTCCECDGVGADGGVDDKRGGSFLDFFYSSRVGKSAFGRDGLGVFCGG